MAATAGLVTSLSEVLAMHTTHPYVRTTRSLAETHQLPTCLVFQLQGHVLEMAHVQ